MRRDKPRSSSRERNARPSTSTPRRVCRAFPGPEDLDQRRAHLVLAFALLTAVLGPRSALLSRNSGCRRSRGRQDADPQHAAPPDQVAKQAPRSRSPAGTEAHEPLQDALNKPGRADRPLLIASAPAAISAPCRCLGGCGTPQEEQQVAKYGDELTDRIPKIEHHQRVLQARPDRPSQTDATARAARIHNVSAGSTPTR